MNTRLKKGYHYTSIENWRKIKREGKMLPHPIHQENTAIRDFFPDGVDGIWLWEKNLTGLSHAGTLILQFARKSSQQIVKLEVKYNPQEALHSEGRLMEFQHLGTIENHCYHKKETAVIIPQEIELSRIKLLNVYDIVKRLK